MRTLSAAKWALFSVICLAWTASLPADDVKITQPPSAWEIRTPTYRAVLAPDGCLTNLQVAGQEFFAPGAGISRGSYFYLNGPLSLSRIEQSGPQQLTASNDQAAITYDFAPGAMTWTLTSKHDAELVFFLVLSDGVQAVQRGEGAFEKPVVSGDDVSSTWHRGGAKMKVEGSTRLWGPFAGSHQVWELRIPAGETKRIQFELSTASAADLQAIAALTPPPDEKDVTLLSPQPWQVFQRRSLNQGPALISGRTRLPATQVRARVVGESRFGQVSHDWVSLPMIAKTREFQAVWNVPAGGWYELEVEVLNGQQVVGQARVEKFGMGEVFVGAGQSNSTNCGQFPIQQTSGMVSSFGGDDWRIADDPQPGAADRSTGGSFWPAFGDALYEKYQVPIGVAVTGFGGTSVNQWQPGPGLFTWMMTRVHKLGPGGFRAILWHQGESDVQMSSDEYYDKLTRVIQTSRATAGWEVPWVVAQVSYHNPDKPRFDSTRTAQAKLWADGVALEGPDTDQLAGENRDFEGKGIHFSPVGLKAHGVMWAEKVAPLLDALPTTP